MSDFGTELKQVVRRLMRSPLFTVVTLVTIAIGVGANSAIFTVINGVLLKPLPYPDPERLVSVWQTAPGIGITDLNASPSDYFTFREENRTFQHFGIWTNDSVSVTGLGRFTCCQPLAVSLVKVAEASNMPVALQRLPTWVPTFCGPL